MCACVRVCVCVRACVWVGGRCMHACVCMPVPQPARDRNHGTHYRTQATNTTPTLNARQKALNNQLLQDNRELDEGSNAGRQAGSVPEKSGPSEGGRLEDLAPCRQCISLLGRTQAAPFVGLTARGALSLVSMPLAGRLLVWSRHSVASSTSLLSFMCGKRSEGGWGAWVGR